MACAHSQLPYSCRSMLFFGVETNGLIKGSSIAVVLEDRMKDGVGDGAGDGAGEHTHKACR